MEHGFAEHPGVENSGLTLKLTDPVP